MGILESISAFLVSIGVNPSHLFAGLAGAFVRAVMTRSNSFIEAITGGFAGTACAVYLTPLVIKYLGIIPVDVALNNGIAFGIGLIGVYLTEGFIRIAQRWAANPKLPDSNSLQDIVDAVKEHKDADKDD